MCFFVLMDFHNMIISMSVVQADFNQPVLPFCPFNFGQDTDHVSLLLLLTQIQFEHHQETMEMQVGVFDVFKTYGIQNFSEKMFSEKISAMVHIDCCMAHHDYVLFCLRYG